MASPTVKLYSPIGGPIQTLFSGTVAPSAIDGSIVVNSQDVPFLLAAGCLYLDTLHPYYTPGFAPAAGSATLFLASTALTNTTFAIAAQVDVPRQGAIAVVPGAAAITAGTLTLTYTAHDGTTQVDTFSLVTPASTTLNLVTTKGIEVMTSMVTAGVVGGSSPTITIGTNNTLGLPVEAPSSVVVVTKEVHTGVNATIGTVVSNGGIAQGLFTPSAAPNGTITYGFWYNYESPIL